MIARCSTHQDFVALCYSRKMHYGTDDTVARKQRGSPGTPLGAGGARELGRGQYPGPPEGRQAGAKTCRGRCAERAINPCGACRPAEPEGARRPEASSRTGSTNHAGASVPHVATFMTCSALAPRSHLPSRSGDSAPSVGASSTGGLGSLPRWPIRRSGGAAPPVRRGWPR